MVVHTLLNSIALTLSDYRADEFGIMKAEHIDRWVKQFDESVQFNILEELYYVFKKTYISKEKVKNIIRKIILSEIIGGKTPALFWENAELLNIQSGGESQTEMNSLLSAAVQAEYGFSIDENKNVENYIYLDDAIFTGNKLLNDLSAWLTSVTIPAGAEIHIIVIASHKGGNYYAFSNLKKRLMQTNNQDIPINIWHFVEIEDRRAYINNSDVLRPVSIPDDPLTKIYIKGMQYKPDLRVAGNVGDINIFSSEKGRHLLEQEFLKAGVRIRSMCPYLNKYQRPLGNMVLDTLGFGSMLVTYRNCPNNNPLALWAGDPWYPLLPRKVN